jgi:hypothetical protein
MGLLHAGVPIDRTFERAFPQVNIEKIGDDVKVGDVITQSLDLTPSYDIATGYAIQAYVANNANTGY